MIGDYTKQLKSPGDDGTQWWFKEMDRAVRRRDQEKPRWKLNEDNENLKQWNGEFGEGDQVTINKLGSYIRTFRASVAYRNPRVRIRPTTAAGYEAVQVPMMDPAGGPKYNQDGSVAVRAVRKYMLREALLNDIISKPLFGLAKTVSRLTKAGVLGYGALKVGYSPSFKTKPEGEGEERGIPIREDGSLDTSAFLIDPVTKLPMKDDSGEFIKKDNIPVWEEWFIDWTHYRHILIDPDGENDFMRHRWVAQEIIRPLDDVKADPLFKNTKDLEASDEEWDAEDINVTGGPELEVMDEFVERSKMVRLFEIYDFVNDEILVLADGHGKYLRKERTPLGISHSPFVFLRFNEILGEFYNRPVASDLVPIGQEYNEARRYQMLARKNSARKVLLKEGVLDVQAEEALRSDEDMALVKIKTDAAYGIGDAIVPYTPPPVNAALYADTDLIARDFDEVGGWPGEARGVASSKTATGINEMSQYSGIRLDFDRNVLADCLTEALKKLNDSIDVNMTMERAIQLEGDDGQAFTAIVDKDMIACDCDIEIDVTEMAPANDMMLATHRLQLIQAAGQSPWMFANEDLARGWCEMFQIKDEKFIQALAKMAEMQMQALAQQAAPQGESPEAGPPGDPAQMLSQAGAGGQTPNMQGGS